MASPTAEVAPAAEGSKGSVEPGRAYRPPLGPVRRGIRELGLALITIGVIILLFVGYQLWGTGFAERHSQATLKRGFEAAVVASSGDNPTVGTAGTGNQSSQSPALSGAIDHMVIPRIKLDKYVVQGVAEQDLQQGPGHYPQTPLPGQDGNAAIAGHRTTYGAPFFDLNELSVGDPIYLTDTAGMTFTYKVSEPPKVVSPSDTAVLDNTPFPELTLTTCNPRFSATSRLVVVARLTGRPPLPVTHPANVAPVAAAVDNLGSGNRAAWPPAIAYGALVALLWVGVRILINRKRRWTRLAAYIAGIGVCLVPLWFCFENVVRLLPQNI